LSSAGDARLEHVVRAVGESVYQRDFARSVGRLPDADAYAAAPFGDAMSVDFGVPRDDGLRLDPAFTMALRAMV
jgi:hypothetical protein